MDITVSDGDCCDGQQVKVDVFQGESVLIEITFPYDISGYNFKSTINFPTPIVLTNGSGIEITDAANGEITLALTTAQTQNIPAGQYAFDLWQSVPPSPDFNANEINGFFNILKSLTKIS